MKNDWLNHTSKNNYSVKNLLKKEAGTSLIEFTLAFPVFLLAISGTISFLLLMFNVLGAHIAIFSTLRDLTVEVPAMISSNSSGSNIQAGAFAARQINSRLNGLVSKAYVSEITFQAQSENGTNVNPCRITKNNPAGCDNYTIEPGSFFSISIPVSFIDFTSLGLPPLTLTAFATIKIQDSDE